MISEIGDIWYQSFLLIWEHWGYLVSTNTLITYPLFLLIECGRENGEENGTNLEGIFFGPFLLGRAIDMETGNESAFVGIGEYNKTNFRWRVMAKSGPVLYMKGTFTEFE